MAKKSLTFDKFLSENNLHKMYSEEEEAELQQQIEQPEVVDTETEHVEEISEVEMPNQHNETSTKSKAIFLYGGVDLLNSEQNDSVKAMNDAILQLTCCDSEIVKLQQLNIQPVAETEPADGMTMIYEKISSASVVVMVSPITDDTVSSLIQNCIKRLAFHYKNLELKNKLFVAILIGDSSKYQNVKADLNNQLNNLGLIIPANNVVFSLDQVSTTITDVISLVDATSTLRTSVTEPTTNSDAVMNFDEFEQTSQNSTEDLAVTSQVEEPELAKVVADTADTESEKLAKELDSEIEQVEVGPENSVKTEEPENDTETEEGSDESDDEVEIDIDEEDEEVKKMADDIGLTPKQLKTLPEELLKAIAKKKGLDFKKEKEKIEEEEIYKSSPTEMSESKVEKFDKVTKSADKNISEKEVDLDKDSKEVKTPEYSKKMSKSKPTETKVKKVEDKEIGESKIKSFSSFVKTKM